MAEFTAITTQEAFDAAIKDRLARAEEKYTKKYEGYLSGDDVRKLKDGYDKQIADLQAAADATAKKYADIDKQIAEKDAKIKGYETASVKARIAHETGLPYDAVGFLQGEDENAIRESANALKALTGNRQPAPLADPERSAGDKKEAALKSMLAQMKQ